MDGWMNDWLRVFSGRLRSSSGASERLVKSYWTESCCPVSGHSSRVVVIHRGVWSIVGGQL